MIKFLIAYLLFISSAFAQVTTGIWSPTTVLPTDGLSSTIWQASDVMECEDWTPVVDITNATSMAIGTGGSFSANTCGLTIYNSNGTTVIRAATTSCSASFGGTQFGSLTAFTLNAGTAYRTCWCISAGGGGTYAGIAGSENISAVHNAFVNHTGTAANSCSSGVTPATTGAITGADIVPLVVFISKE